MAPTLSSTKLPVPSVFLAMPGRAASPNSASLLIAGDAGDRNPGRAPRAVGDRSEATTRWPARSAAPARVHRSTSHRSTDHCRVECRRHRTAGVGDIGGTTAPAVRFRWTRRRPCRAPTPRRSGCCARSRRLELEAVEVRVEPQPGGVPDLGEVTPPRATVHGGRRFAGPPHDRGAGPRLPRWTDFQATAVSRCVRNTDGSRPHHSRPSRPRRSTSPAPPPRIPRRRARPNAGCGVDLGKLLVAASVTSRRRNTHGWHARRPRHRWPIDARPARTSASGPVVSGVASSWNSSAAVTGRLLVRRVGAGRWRASLSPPSLWRIVLPLPGGVLSPPGSTAAGGRTWRGWRRTPRR